MNSTEKGKLIAKLRREAGYTQQSLAEMLYITDKAVSKWERGLSNPDSALLPKLSALLDSDIEMLISGSAEYIKEEWTGVLIINRRDVSEIVFDKPIIHYLLSYFLLVGITEIQIVTDNKSYINSLNLSQYGINVRYEEIKSYKKMIIFDDFFLFGANFSRQFSVSMSKTVSILPTVDGIELPILFKHGFESIDTARKSAERRPMLRGMLYIPLDTDKNIADAAEVVKIYNKHHNKNICDLKEIAENRRII